MVVANLYVEFTYWAHGFPKKPVVRTLSMKLMEARQYLNHVLVHILFNANGARSGLQRFEVVKFFGALLDFV